MPKLHQVTIPHSVFAELQNFRGQSRLPRPALDHPECRRHLRSCSTAESIAAPLSDPDTNSPTAPAMYQQRFICIMCTTCFIRTFYIICTIRNIMPYRLVRRGSHAKTPSGDHSP